MASSSIIYIPEEDSSSDYGSDFSPELVEKLIAITTLDEQEDESATSALQEEGSVVRDIEDLEDIGDDGWFGRKHARRQSASGREIHYPVLAALRAASENGEVDVEFAAKGDESRSREDTAFATKNTSRTRSQAEMDENFLESFLAANEREAEVVESPLQRFRSDPNKQALSVTDLVSTAWCELQYFYQLRTGKRKRRTAAMKKGTKVHKALEEEVFKSIVVTTVTREDGWGLRIWNVIQGLKTLRETGLTRELEVWGIIDGQVVNGVIDELSYQCPDEDMEEYHVQLQLRDDAAPNGQKTISDYFMTSGNSSLKSALGGNSMSFAPKDANTFGSPKQDLKRIYITDIKTRGSNRLPDDASFRPTKMQLMLYHRLLRQLSSNAVDFPLLASRYNLDITAPFSDSFITQMVNIQDSPLSPSSPSLSPSQYTEEDSLAILLAHNNLSLLWPLMISEFLKTFPSGRDSIGNILQAEYRTPAVKSTGGRILGSKIFPMVENVLDIYLEYEMRWWRGQRDPVGVVAAEASKCGYCDFAAGCEWRMEREEEFKEAAATRKAWGARGNSIEGFNVVADLNLKAGGGGNSMSPSEVDGDREVKKGKRRVKRVEVEVEREESDGTGDGDVEMSDTQSTIPERKKRGRPRKIEMPPSVPLSIDDTETPKKRRGRPRKVVGTGEDAAPLEKGIVAIVSRDEGLDSEYERERAAKEEWERVQLGLMVAEAEAEVSDEVERGKGW